MGNAIFSGSFIGPDSAARPSLAHMTNEPEGSFANQGIIDTGNH